MTKENPFYESEPQHRPAPTRPREGRGQYGVAGDDKPEPDPEGPPEPGRGRNDRSESDQAGQAHKRSDGAGEKADPETSAQRRPASQGEESGDAPRAWGRRAIIVIWGVCGVLLAAAAGVYILKQFGVLDGERGLGAAVSITQPANNPLWLNLAVFAVGAAVVWVAGTKLSTYADLISERTNLEQAFVGLLLLAVATSLPEVATTITSAFIGAPGLMVGNLLGGGAMQIAILAVMDLLFVRGALTFFAPKPVLIINGVMLIGLLTVAILGVSVGATWSVMNVGPWGAAVFVIFLLMLWMTHAEVHHPPWKPTNPPEEIDGSELKKQEMRRYRDVSNRRLYLSYGAGALVILAAGFVVTRVADAIDQQTGLGETLVGAVLLAAATSLPEISTTSKAVRLGAYSMAVSGIFGSSAFNASLLFLGDLLYRDGPIFASAPQSAVLLAGAAILMTCAFLWGLLERKDRTVFRLGIDSWMVLVLYVCALALLYTMDSAG